MLPKTEAEVKWISKFKVLIVILLDYDGLLLARVLTISKMA